jgi:acetyltransferase-like isoleucine patch superfamily enzyme
MTAPGTGRLSRIPWKLRYELGARVASDVRRALVVCTHRHCRVEFRGPVHLGPGFTLNIPDRGTLVIGAGVELRRDFVCEISGNGRVTIGDGCIFTAGALVQCSTSIDIGNRCVFAQSPMLVDGKHCYGDPRLHSLEQGYDYRPLRIGEGVMVMSKCTIFADIGEGAFVGAHSVVSRPLPPHCLAIGAPARVVSSFDSIAARRGATPATDGASPTHNGASSHHAGESLTSAWEEPGAR